jgi:hypothetical protein
MEGFAYHGHYIRLEPEPAGDSWEAQVVVEVHSGGKVERIYYHDHEHQYPTREEAVSASGEFGKRMVDNFTLPAVGEGDFSGTAT